MTTATLKKDTNLCLENTLHKILENSFLGWMIAWRKKIIKEQYKETLEAINKELSARPKKRDG